MLVKVRDRKSGNERTVTQKAYAALGPKVYEKLGFVNEDGSEVGTLPNPNPAQVSRSVKGAVPVVVRQQLVSVPKEEVVIEEQEQPELVQVKRKPGRQPGSKNKSISSNSTEDEK